MGFFNKIKNTFNQMTGSTGNIQLRINKAQYARGESIDVAFTLYATGALKGKSVNIELVATERIKFQVPVQNTSSSSNSSWTRTEERTQEHQTYRHVEMLDAAGIQLNEGESREYTGTLRVPEVTQATYQGVNAQHTWQVRAFVDVPMGGDIDAETDIAVL
ncbi:MAG TPA: hypothetical protein VEX13_10040 [Chloroflexia bacterium]|nr:hypothetical protein [Chloroflexia bacterium]